MGIYGAKPAGIGMGQCTWAAAIVSRCLIVFLLQSVRVVVCLVRRGCFVAASGIELAREQVARVFDLHGMTKLPAWFCELSGNVKFRENTAADIASICDECKYASHPSAGPFVISHQVLTRIVKMYTQGPRSRPALVAVCSLLLRFLD